MKKQLLIFFIAAWMGLPLCAQIPLEDTNGYTPTRIQYYNPRPSKMFSRVYVPLRPAQDTSDVRMITDVEYVSIATEYYDYMGRTVQKVTRQSSPNKKDMVVPVLYDAFSRVVDQYPSYVQQTHNNNDGRYKDSALLRDSIFYRALFPMEDTIYSHAQYDASPLQRILKSTAQGDSWTGANVGKTLTQRSNAVSDSVRLWTIDITGEDDVPSTSGVYATGSLIADEVTDELGIKSIVYKNEAGKAVLLKQQLANSPSTGHTGWLCTYYIYDEMDNLRMVLPPKAVEALIAVSWDLSGNASIRTGLCYAYYYDNKDRQVMKYIPGKGKSYIVYDLFGRTVMTQDSYLRQTNQWSFVKYDSQSRPIKSGLITISINKDSVLAQAYRTADYPTLTGTYTIMAETFYDDYAWVSSQSAPLSANLDGSHINSANFETASFNTAPMYAQQISETKRIRGSATGTKRLILGTSNYLWTLSLFDQYGRGIQTKATNYSGGIDIATRQFDFAGRVLFSHFTQQKSGVNAQTHTVATRFVYDHAGRIQTITKNVDSLGEQNISLSKYNELGQLQQKILDIQPGPAQNGIEKLNYEYDILGRTIGMNRDYIKEVSNNNWFGFEMAYEKTANVISGQTYANSQVNGNIAGVTWRSKGDGEKRKFDYIYDNANRLLSADFSQYTGGNFNKTAGLDFSLSNMSYDANGNILSMQQKGFKLNGSSPIDQLRYSYITNSNQLQQVYDTANDNGSRLGDFKYDGTSKTFTDYTYDVNGNVIADQNKKIGSITYNHLDLPTLIAIPGKGTIAYTYDAIGAKLKKVVVDSTGSSITITTTLYMSGIIYQNDTLQFISHEEGRIRYKAGVFHYDFMLRDHLGNVRMILTKEQQTDAYPVASLETSSVTNEQNYYGGLTIGRVDRNTVSGYPVDTTYTNPNDFIQKLNGVSGRMGANMLLKVMAGDKFNFHVNSWWNSGNSPGSSVSPLNDLLTSLNGGIAVNSGGKATSGELSGSNTLLPGATSFLDSHTGDTINKPKAFVNWVLFDEQFNLVSASSGFEQVGNINSLTSHVRTDMPVSKNGYLYIYVSNETPNIDVFFDNLQVTHIRGPLLEEAHYYPFGLEMKAISTRALNFGRKTEYRANGGTEIEEDFGLNLFSTFYRQYDYQLGRFLGIDIRSEETYQFSCYQYAINNPISFIDLLGDKYDLPVSMGNGWYKMPDGRMVGWGDVEWYLKERNLLSTVWSAEDAGGGGGSILSWDLGTSRATDEQGFRLTISWTFGSTSGQFNQGLGLSSIFVGFGSLRDIGVPTGTSWPPKWPSGVGGAPGSGPGGYQFPWVTLGGTFSSAGQFAMYNKFGWTSLIQSWKHKKWVTYPLTTPGSKWTGGKIKHGKAISTKFSWMGRAFGAYSAYTTAESWYNGEIGTTRMLIEQGSNAYSVFGGPIGACWGIGWEAGRAITSNEWYRRNIRTGIRDFFGLERDEFVEDEKLDRVLRAMEKYQNYKFD